MKPIKIARRFRPFSRLPGTKVLLLGSSRELTIYPTHLHLGENYALDFPLTGPIEKFTVMQDLEAMQIIVSGFSKEGHFRYEIAQCGSEIVLKKKKGNFSSAVFEVPEKVMLPKHIERLCLGCHKKQDIELIKRRCDLTEILPIWYRLSQLYLEEPEDAVGGNFALLKQCEMDLESFRHLFTSAFVGLFSPRHTDENFLGFPQSMAEGSHFQILSQGGKLIRSFFVSSYQNELKVLPKLPKFIHCGRMIGALQEGYEVDFEWSKGLIRRMILRAKASKEIKLSFQKAVRTFRFQRLSANCFHRKESRFFPRSGSLEAEASSEELVQVEEVLLGEKILPRFGGMNLQTGSQENKTLKNGEKISIKPGETYFFDHFQK